MKITAHRIRRRSGFTLIEIIIVMVIVSITIGSSILILVNDSSDELQTLPIEIEQLAKQSLNRSKLKKQTQYIIITKDRLWITSDPEEQEPLSMNKEKIDFPANFSISYKSTRDSQWASISREADRAIWVFSIGGICEEISLKIAIGSSTAELNFHPLTAALKTN